MTEEAAKNRIAKWTEERYKITEAAEFRFKILTENFRDFGNAVIDDLFK